MSRCRLSDFYRHAFVTGASAGLGRAFAEMLLAEGVPTWGTAREVSRLEDFRGRMGGESAGAKFSPVQLDLSDAEGASAAFERAANEAGGAFDVVIANAGYGAFGNFSDTDFTIWQEQLNAMLLTTARLSHAALRRMRVQDRGSLVHVSSLATEFPLPFMAGYNMAKAGLSALSESLCVETRGSGVTVIDFRPGDYRTSFNRSMQSIIPVAPLSEATTARAWRTLERNLNSAPLPMRAAADLRSALWRRRSGVVRSGSFFQARLAPLLARFVPGSLRRRVAARYFGLT